MLSLLATLALALGGDPPACPRPAAVVAGADRAADDRGIDRGTVLVTFPDTGAAATFRAWGVDLRLDAPRTPVVRGAPRTAPAEVRLTRAADARAQAASRQRIAGERLPVVWLESSDSAIAAGPSADGADAARARPAVRVRLAGVTVVAQRLTFPEPADALDDQAAALAADVCQLRADRAEAARRLVELEALDRRKLAAAFELARAGEQVGVLDARLAAAERRLRLLAARAARAALPTEELTLHAEHAEVVGDTAATARAAVGRGAGGR